MQSNNINVHNDWDDVTGGLTDDHKTLVDNLVTELKSSRAENVEESKDAKVVATPGLRTVIKSGEDFQVFAVMRKNIANGRTDFVKLDHAGVTKDGERVINLDDIPQAERVERERKPRKEREPKEPREKSAKREKRDKSEKKQKRETVMPQDKEERKRERSARREQKREVNAVKREERAMKQEWKGHMKKGDCFKTPEEVH